MKISDKDRFEKWLVALESGKYRQTHYTLYVADEDNTDRYCCLGVYCLINRLRSKKQMLEGVCLMDVDVYTFHNVKIPKRYLPNNLIDPNTLETYCIYLNDEKDFSFQQIAAKLRTPKLYDCIMEQLS